MAERAADRAADRAAGGTAKKTRGELLAEAEREARELESAVKAAAEKLEKATSDANAGKEIREGAKKTLQTIQEALGRKAVVVVAGAKRGEDGEQRRINRWWIWISAALVLVALGMVGNDAVVEGGYRWGTSWVFRYMALIPAGAVVALLIFLLWKVAERGTQEEKDVKWRVMPDRGPAIVMFACFYITLILGFAHLNLANGLTERVGESLYKAALTVVAFYHEGYEGATGAWPKMLVVGELFSVVLLIFVFFPMLIGRLAVFRGDAVSLEEFRAGAAGGKRTVEVEFEEEVTVKRGEETVEAKKVRVEVAADGGVEVERVG